jgi:hypothetical protein
VKIRARGRTARAIAMVMRVVGSKESGGGMAMAIVTWVMGKWTAMATKRAMATSTREAGKEEGNGKGGKSNGDGNKEGNGGKEGDSKQQQQS